MSGYGGRRVTLNEDRWRMQVRIEDGQVIREAIGPHEAPIRRMFDDLELYEGETVELQYRVAGTSRFRTLAKRAAS